MCTLNTYTYHVIMIHKYGYYSLLKTIKMAYMRTPKLSVSQLIQGTALTLNDITYTQREISVFTLHTTAEMNLTIFEEGEEAILEKEWGMLKRRKLRLQRQQGVPRYC